LGIGQIGPQQHWFFDHNWIGNGGGQQADSAFVPKDKCTGIKGPFFLRHPKTQVHIGTSFICNVRVDNHPKVVDLNVAEVDRPKVAHGIGVPFTGGALP